MIFNKRNLPLVILSFLFNLSYCLAQTPSESSKENNRSFINFDTQISPSLQDGAYKRDLRLESYSLPFEPIREADVAWSKRVWREIDTRQKANKVFVNEHQPFVEALIQIITTDNIDIYTDDTFTQTMDKETIWEKLYYRDTIKIWDFKAEEFEEEQVDNDINYEQYTYLRLKEDWIFDSKASRMRARIIGIAPVRDVLDPSTGQIRGQEALFWVHYESIRDLLTKFQAFTDYEDNQHFSWADIFDMRYFYSMITKESNNYGYSIRDYKTGRAVKKEADRIHAKMRDFEYRLWSH